MLINELIGNLGEKALITPLTPTRMIVFDKGELKVFVGFTKNREAVEYTKEVTLFPSTPILAEIRDIIVSRNGDFAILEAPRALYVLRIGSEILMTSPERLPAECYVECYSLHDSLFLQNSAISVVQTRLLSRKCDEKQILAVLYSDNCVRFYNIQQKMNGFLLSIDFRHLLHQNLDESVANKTLGMQKSLVSFDMIPPLPKQTHLSLIVVDSDAEFYGSFVHFSCFKEGTVPRVRRLEAVDGLPCDPLDLKCLETSNPKVCSVFTLVSGGSVLSHLIVFANEFGEFQILVNDQLRLPQSSGDPRIVPNQIRRLNKNRYEVATATCLFSVNISPWLENLNAGASPQDTRVVELVSAVSSELCVKKNSKVFTGARALRAVSVLLTKPLTENNSDDVDSEEVMHLVVLNGNEHVFTVATFDKLYDPKPTTSKSPQATPSLAGSASSKMTLEQHIAELKPLPACAISDKIPQEEAIEAALKFLDFCEQRLRKHTRMGKLAVERCLQLTATAHALAEKQQKVDERLVMETTTVEELKKKMHELKSRVESTRKAMNILFHRVEENVPLSDNETRIFERLKEHQKMLTDLSIQVPKMTLDSNELRRMADVFARRRFGDEPTKFVNIEKNAAEIENLELREQKLIDAIAELSV